MESQKNNESHEQTPKVKNNNVVPEIFVKSKMVTNDAIKTILDYKNHNSDNNSSVQNKPESNIKVVQVFQNQLHILESDQVKNSLEEQKKALENGMYKNIEKKYLDISNDKLEQIFLAFSMRGNFRVANIPKEGREKLIELKNKYDSIMKQYLNNLIPENRRIELLENFTIYEAKNYKSNFQEQIVSKENHPFVRSFENLLYNLESIKVKSSLEEQESALKSGMYSELKKLYKNITADHIEQIFLAFEKRTAFKLPSMPLEERKKVLDIKSKYDSTTKQYLYNLIPEERRTELLQQESAQWERVPL